MSLDGKTVYFLGKLAASNRKEAGEVVKRQGGKVSKTLVPTVSMVVVGEGDVLSRDWNLWNDQLDDATRDAFEAGTLEIVSEAFFWDQFGVTSRDDLLENDKDEDKTPRENRSRLELNRPFYTPSMLADLSQLPIAIVRQLQQRKLIVPARQVHRLNYYDFENVFLLKIVKNMLDAGLSFPRVADRLVRIKRRIPGVPREARIEGKDVLFQTDRGLFDQDGQQRFEFPEDRDSLSHGSTCDSDKDSERLQNVFDQILHGSESGVRTGPHDVGSLVESAFALESDGDLNGSLSLYRSALAAGGPNPQINFQVAELLYRLGDLTAARERYFATIEQDEEFVEARANLGCVLAELGEDELAAAAFRGALRYHPDYAEVHYHLGLLLRRQGFGEEAEEHLQLFRELMPESPWTF